MMAIITKPCDHIKNQIHVKIYTIQNPTNQSVYPCLLHPTLQLKPTPPEYNVTELQVPTALFSGSKDWLADPEDVKALVPKIQDTLFNHTNLVTYEHLDFIWGLSARFDVYDVVINMTKRFL